MVAGPPTGPVEVPPLVHAFAERIDDVVWANEIGGYTFVAGDRFLKWNPRGSGVDLEDERVRLHWARTIGHPVPPVLDLGRDDDGQVLVTRSLPGTGAVTGEWLDRPRDAVRAIAAGLRALHDKVPAAACPFRTAWIPADAPRPDDGAVVLHGDACAPNTIIGPDGRFAGHVDLGSIGVGDRWADLAVASMSLDGNYGEGWQDEFFHAYGVIPDAERIHYYRTAWDAAP
ncbi:phosphotransferase [Pseudolysinimonas sp.]|uniref:phosphotransferase n=1 Tax=Pseudolysinimonas sp. TaxID=2680009 RepID=UPI0037846D7D